jgi:hypothetical protein
MRERNSELQRNSDLQRRLSSWRETAGISEPSPLRTDNSREVRAHMRGQNSLLRTLLLDTVTEIDTTLYALEVYMDQGNRSELHAQFLDERAAAALHTYERAVARVLERAIGDVPQDLPQEREVIKTVYIQPPPAKPWWKRIFGG